MKLKIKTQCKECGKMFEDSMEFTSHLSGEHDMNAREYYDKYLRDESTGKCLNCGSTDIKWRNIVVGYDRFCSAKCSRQFQEKNATGATIKCPICQSEVTGANNNRASQAFTKHLKDVHELKAEEAVDNYSDALNSKNAEAFLNCFKETDSKYADGFLNNVKSCKINNSELFWADQSNDEYILKVDRTLISEEGKQMGSLGTGEVDRTDYWLVKITNGEPKIICQYDLFSDTVSELTVYKEFENNGT